MTNKTTQDRRTAFYAAEANERLPEEPNIRVYGRCISAALEVARRGLGRKAFSSLMLALVEEARDLGADIHANPTPPCLFAVHGNGVCHLPHGHREDHWFGAPALSPRQALGEALACVERAQRLLHSTLAAPALLPSEVDGRIATLRACDNASRAWADITNARALLVEP